MKTIDRKQHMYRKEEMLAYARACGFTISETTFRDWIKVGLIERK